MKREWLNVQVSHCVMIIDVRRGLETKLPAIFILLHPNKKLNKNPGKRCFTVY